MDFAPVPSVSGHRPESDVFWSEISAGEHLLQIYEEDAVLLDALEGFIAGGLVAGEAAVVIATAAHRTALEARFAARGLDAAALAASDRYIAVDAAETLAQFMVDGWPDEERFAQLVNDLISRARSTGRPVRAFGEMVAILWAQKNQGATVRLEHLWTQLCQRRAFSLLCSYPKAGFTHSPARSIETICAAHSRLMPA